MTNYEDFSDDAKKTFNQLIEFLKDPNIKKCKNFPGIYTLDDEFFHCDDFIKIFCLLNKVNSLNEQNAIIQLARSKNYWLK